MIPTNIPLAAAASPPLWTIVPGSASAIVSGVLLYFTYRLFRRGSDDRRQEQARRVYAVQEVSRILPGRIRLKITVHNKSDLPIWDVDVYPARAGALQLVDEQQRFPMIEPDSLHLFEVTISGDASRGPVDQAPHISFSDHAGRIWTKVGAELREERRPAERLPVTARIAERADRVKRSRHHAA